MLKRLFFTNALIVLVVCVFAQTPLQVPYFCGFEDPAENANWHFETSTDNEWVVGTAEKNEGQNSIYVSCTKGQQAGTSVSPGYMILYKEMTLEAGVQYEVSFDWKNPGIGLSELYVAWVDASFVPGVPGFSSPSYDFPSWLKDNLIPINGGQALASSPIWQNVVFELMGNGKPKKLIFFFRSKRSSTHDKSGRHFPSACIDNVQIAKQLDCKRPLDIKYVQLDVNRGVFRWAEDLGPFELMYKGVSDEQWTTVKNIDYDYFDAANRCYSLPVRPLQKGGYIAKVRQICDPMDGSAPDTSIWTTVNILVHYSSNSCLDFLDLHGENVDCYIGNTNNTAYDSGKITPVDFGFSSARSRHTVHYVQEEYDVETDYMLETTYGGMPSVRLGNPLISPNDMSGVGDAEAITYHFRVPEEAPLILVKYAIVIQAPTDHDPEEQPAFRMIISRDGMVEDDMVCGQADFYADEGLLDEDTTWHLGPVRLNGANVMWKEWTSTGLNLSNYIGEDIDISFETQDCTRPGHFGYAYFMLDCMGAKISGIGCGDSMFGQIEAPEGFNYKWYPRSMVEGLEEADSAQVLQDYFDDPDFKDTERTFSPPGGISDDGVYVCRIISQEEEDCWFELQADLDPRDVFAQSDIATDYVDCQATVRFNNTSYTKTRNRGDIGSCDAFLWDFGDGSEYSFEENPHHVFAPGTYEVKMTASISDGLCDDVWDTTITILPYGESIDTIHVHRCTKDPYYTFVDGVTYETTGIREHIIKGFAGCDSTIVLDMVVGEEVAIEYADTTDTEHLPYDFFGNELTSTGVYETTVYGRDNQCDTLYKLHLNVWEVLHMDFDPDSLPYACYGDSVISFPYGVISGTFDFYDLEFDEASLEVGFENQIEVYDSVAKGQIVIDIPTDAIPGYYPATVTFDGDTTGTETFSITVDLLYESSIIEQKWNDVIAVVSTPDYEFDAFGWYCNGQLIAGVNGPNLYTPGTTLQFGAEYQALLRRASDGVSVLTCPIEAVDRSDQTLSNYPTIAVSPTQAAPSSKLTVDMPSDQMATVSVFDVLGKNWGVYHISSSDPYITVPSNEGIYVVRIALDNGYTHTVKITVR